MTTIKQKIEQDTRYREILDKLETLAEKSKKHNNVINEGGEGFNPYDEKISQAVASLHARKIQIMAENLAHVRQEWDAAIAPISTSKGVHIKDFTAMQRQLGYTIDDCKEAKAAKAAAKA